MTQKFILIIFMLVLVAGCARTVKYMKYTTDKYSPTTSIEVLRVKPITKNFIELGELKLRISKRNEETAVLSLKEKAKSIGADAIIILGENSGGAVAMPINTGQGAMYIVINKRYLKALAIKYKKP